MASINAVRLGPIQETVKHTTKTYNGKTYPMTITKQVGLQEIEVDGEKIRIEALSIFESALGTSLVWTRETRPASQEERARNRENVRQAIVQAMVDQGYW